MPDLPLVPSLVFGKVLTYKDTPVYRDPFTNTVISTIPAGKVVPIASPELLGWIGVGLLLEGKIVTGLMKSADVAIEIDRMRLAVRVIRATQSFSGPSEVFVKGSQLAPGTIATAFQESNGFYRIGVSTWIATADTQTISDPKKAVPFNWKAMLPYGVAAVGFGAAYYYYNRSRRARKSSSVEE
jgi:hypothetical protein